MTFFKCSIELIYFLVRPTHLPRINRTYVCVCLCVCRRQKDVSLLAIVRALECVAQDYSVKALSLYSFFIFSPFISLI